MALRWYCIGKQRIGVHTIQHEPPKGRMCRIHEWEISADDFDAVVSGKKRFELRKNDKHYTVGDTVHVHEVSGRERTGRTITADVKYVLDCTCGYVVFVEARTGKT